jgi:NAD(P)-dependent dehydrogenase (short-subunit alcohol dehydrogenase family)
MTEKIFPEGAVLAVGGSGGVGQAVCLELARAGSDVAVTYHKKKDAAESVAAKIRALGRKATIHQLTLGDAASDRAAYVTGQRVAVAGGYGL